MQFLTQTPILNMQSYYVSLQSFGVTMQSYQFSL